MVTIPLTLGAPVPQPDIAMIEAATSQRDCRNQRRLSIPSGGASDQGMKIDSVVCHGESISPPLIVPIACQVLRSMDAEMNRTAASAKATCTPPGCLLRAT
jgi:hypothetical protein